MRALTPPWRSASRRLARGARSCLVLLSVGLPLAGCGDPQVRFDGGGLFDAPPATPPAAPIVDEAHSPIPWPVATIRGRAPGARRVIVEGISNPLASSVLPDGTFCIDLRLPAPATYDVAIFAQSGEGLLSSRATAASVVFDPSVPPVPGATTCSGADPAGCSGEVELCDNGRDDDCNGFVDGRDPACASCSDDVLEPNDDASAPRVDPGRIDGLRVCPGNEDYFGVFARAGDTVEARVFFEHASGDLDAHLLGPDRATVLLRASTLTDDEVLSHVAASDGQHVVRVFSPTGEGNDYALDVRVVGGP